MSEYILKIENEPQAEALLAYLRSLDYVELLPKEKDKQEAIKAMKLFLADLPDRQDYNQAEVNEAMNELRAGQHGE